jgi:hypothetical protein
MTFLRFLIARVCLDDSVRELNYITNRNLRQRKIRFVVIRKRS